MGKIIILDENTSNKIAAGEVIERPASVVKELLENAIDAGADNISVEIKNGGISLIKVVDNGSGIEEDDVELAFERHGTSKIRGAKDLEAISTMGFRGEALASIAAVSVVQLTTRTSDSTHGCYIEIRGGTVTDIRQKGCPKGTSFIVRDLFFNTPVRYKFLKKDTTEAGYVSDMVSRIALGNPHISIKLVSNGATVIHTPGNNDLNSTIFSIYGKEVSNNLCKVDYEDEKVRITGFIGKAEISRSNRNQQSFYINRRYIKSKIISAAIDEAYKTLLMKNRYAFSVLNIEVNPLLVDVNVHPSKIEVKFSDEQGLYRSIYHAVNNALLSGTEFRSVEIKSKKDESFFIKEKRQSDNTYEQQIIVPQIQNDGKQYSEQMQNYREKALDIKYEYSKVISPLVTDKVEEDVNTEEDTYENTNRNLNENILKNIDKNTNNSVNYITDENRNISENDNLYKISDSTLVGQAFSTYILLQNEQELILVDQHAAHERIMFEKLKSEYNDNKPMAQMLAVPVVVELTFQEWKFADENRDFFIKIGFIFEDFGNNSIILRSIPSNEQSIAIKDVFLEILDLTMNSDPANLKIVAEDALYSIACKAAVKANKRLNEMEIKQLIKELEVLENPYTCPHGRPTVIKLTKQQLEKMFKRN